MSEEKKVDGWAIWSASGGIYAQLDHEGWEILSIYPSDVYDKDDLSAVKLETDQKIRPCKIVFTDEE